MIKSECNQMGAQPPGELALVNTHSQAALLEGLADNLARGQGFSVATLNLDHIVKMRSNPSFRAAYEQHSHVVADGNPIVWLSRLAGNDIELVPGSELIQPLVEVALRQNVPIAMLGATQETLDATGSVLQDTFPDLQIVAKIAPPFGFDPDGDVAAACLEQINASGAGLCFLALGAPKQEQLAIRGATLAPDCGFVSIGAGLDFIAGHQTRAPRWARRIAMEWLWRLLSSPRRLAKRYWDCIAIMPGLAWRACRVRARTVPPGGK
ncbi:WecB/TagA/CpsF family glycosyltransferase [Sedimentitalea sp.]|uniref:WecB/TagA/CpsF family glycosyltransferase n=1 Tax=Sedimentitalea sp. TaxID=2048915 RepID=UPI0032976141